MHANQITQWKTQLLDGAVGVFMSPAEKRGTEQGPSAKEMQANRPARTVSRFSGSRARSRGRCERRAKIIKIHPLPVKRQAELLKISRSNVYYLRAPTSEKDLALMRAIDELHLKYPFLGAQQLSKILAREGHPHAGRLHVGTLMAKMGTEPPLCKISVVVAQGGYIEKWGRLDQQSTSATNGCSERRI